MRKILSFGIVCVVTCSTILFSLAESTDITTYHLEFRDISLEEAQDVINRSVGSGSVNLKDGEDRLLNVTVYKGSWWEKHQDVKVFGGVPFYGPRGLVVAYEYYLQCGEKICGSIYDVAPGLKDTNDVMNLFVKGSRCVHRDSCHDLGNPGLAERANSYYTFFVPDTNPVSLRLANRIEKGQIKFYHGIYAIGLDDKKVISLDPRDEGLTRKDLKKRLRGLANFSGMSQTLPLLVERARDGDKPFECMIDQEIYGGTMLYSSYGRVSYHRPFCGIDGQKVLALGNYSLTHFGMYDLLTGRIFSFSEPASPADSYKNIPK